MFLENRMEAHLKTCIRKKTLQSITIILALCFLFWNSYVSAAPYNPSEIEYFQEISISKTEKEKLFDYARLIRKKEVKKAEEINFSKDTLAIKTPVIISLFDEDGEIVYNRKSINGKHNIVKKLNFLVGKIPSKHKDKYLHIQVVSYSARLPNFGIKGIFDNKVYEPHVTGLIYDLHGRKAEVNPLQSLERNYTSKNARSFLARKLEIDPKKMPNMNELVIEIYRTIHFGEAYPTREFTEYFRGHKLFTVDDLNTKSLQERIELIGTWYSNNVDNGEVNYQYSPNKDQFFNNQRSMVRSTMSVWVLNRLAFYLNDQELKDLGQEAIDFYYERLLNMEESLDEGRLIPSKKPYGRGDLLVDRWTAAGFLISAVLERGEYEKYKKEINIIFDWIKKYQNSDGVFWTQWGQSQYFMPGQILLSISYLYETTKDEKYKDFFDKSFKAYEAAIFQMLHLGPKTYSPYAPAWFTQPFAKMYEITRDNKYRDVIYAINDNVVKWHRLNFEYAAYFDYEGSLEAKPGYYGNNSITSASLESLCDAAYTAKLDGDMERFKKYQYAVKHATAYLLRLQYIPENTYYFKNKKLTTGGFKKDIISSVLWMDNVWHLTSAFIKIQKNGLIIEKMF